MQRWLVVSNCQTVGTANSLALLNPDAVVEACDVWQLQHEPERWQAAVREFERVFVLHELVTMGLLDVSGVDNVVLLPSVVFTGYHPDLCYAVAGEQAVQTPLSEYNSIIALAAFKKGLHERDALALYNRRIYEAGGYFDVWSAAKTQLLAHFEQLGYELSGQFRRWTLHAAFMHSVNHPKIECIFDIAYLASLKAGAKPLRCPMRPHDNLSNSVAFAIYDEIAEFCGIEGAYLFKVPHQYKLLTLEEFVTASFEAYRARDLDRMQPTLPFRERYNAIYDAI